jgi:hypothetical protein
MNKTDNWLPLQQEQHGMEEAEHTEEFWQGWEAGERETGHSEGPTGRLDDGDALSLALRRIEPGRLEQILDEELPNRTSLRGSARTKAESRDIAHTEKERSR